MDVHVQGLDARPVAGMRRSRAWAPRAMPHAKETLAMSHPSDDVVTRRQALAAGLASAAALAAPASGCDAEARPAADDRAPRAASASRLPVAYVPHGGGPWPFVDLGMDPVEHAELSGYLRSLRALPKTPPRALLVISAHWEAPVPTVMTSARPPMLYDYYGFPPASYAITWPAPGNPALAERVRGLLGAGGFATAADPARGFDHGTFVPFKLTYPDADVPTVQLSLKAGLDPAEHLAMGRALAPLRDEGVLVLGSGMSFHNLRLFREPRASRGIAEAFDAWLRESAVLPEGERDRRLAAWASAPSARQAHPREEHLLPLLVVAGAAGVDRATVAYSGTVFGARISAYHFG
jgi:aromatic ring-opening dioxygenase catalytic subunit (LigB family)